MIFYFKLLITFARRYSDIMVHRLLAVAIGALDSYPDLLSKVKTQVGVQLVQDSTYATESEPALFLSKVETGKEKVVGFEPRRDNTHKLLCQDKGMKIK